MRATPSWAAALWLLAVATHAHVQEAFSWMAREWGFDTIQAVQGALWLGAGPLIVVGAAVRAGRAHGWSGVGAVLGIATVDALGATTFVTRAEALHYPLYATLAWLAAPLGWRIALVAGVAAGVTDELLQWAWLDPARAASLPDGKDMALNALGVATGLVAWRWVRSPRGPP